MIVSPNPRWFTTVPIIIWALSDVITNKLKKKGIK